MRKLLYSLLFLTFVISATAQTDQDSLWIRENYTKKEVYIPMRDGARLFTAIYTPKDQSEAHPFLMTRTPYSCAPYGEKDFTPNLWGRHWK